MRRLVLAAALVAAGVGSVGLVPTAASATTPPSLMAVMPCLGGGHTTVSATPTATGTHVDVTVAKVSKLNWGGGILVGTDAIAQESTQLPAVVGPFSAVGGRFHQAVDVAKPWPQEVLAVYATAHAKQVCGVDMVQNSKGVAAGGNRDVLAVKTSGRTAVALRLDDDVRKGSRWRVVVTVVGGGKQVRTMTLTAGRHGLEAKLRNFRRLAVFRAVVVRATSLSTDQTLLMGVARR